MAVTHLRILSAGDRAPLPARLNLAEFYFKRWPDCLACQLYLADWLMETPETDRAVALLHTAAASDPGGQVAERLWGPRHAYRALWPERLELPLEIPLPAKVAAYLGLNRLPEGPVRAASPLNNRSSSAAGHGGGPEGLQPTAGENTRPGIINGKRAFSLPKGLENVQAEMERMARRFELPGLTRADGRYPVYVIFSVRNSLEKLYGQDAADRLTRSMKTLAAVIRNRVHWDAEVFLADDAGHTERLEISPARPGDPWSLKLALADLDRAFARSGRMIGALLIVGGPEIVPFHHLPNPVDDQDLDVPSDNPYSTRDENYFFPEWPVGRLPAGKGRDPSLLEALLESLIARHSARVPEPHFYERWWSKAADWVHHRLPWNEPGPWPGQRPSLGYTAAAWKTAATDVFVPIGRSRSLLVSPPSGLNGHTNGSPVKVFPAAHLGYFNLHGIQDGPEWFGQRDFTVEDDGPDYPVALRPQDLSACRPIPEIVFSEACYGAYIYEKAPEEALSISFLAAGSLAFAGSTCISYGALQPPLAAADLLGQFFWTYLKRGLPAGEALRQAKIRLARKFHVEQGFLDSEEQKTLISFVLYGDPLALPIETGVTPKNIVRPLDPPLEVKTLSDHDLDGDDARPVSPENMNDVKEIVSRYLPGMRDAQFTVHQKTMPSGSNGQHRKSYTSTIRQRVTLSKQVTRASYHHRQYVRLILDDQGQVIKLVVSR